MTSLRQQLTIRTLLALLVLAVAVPFVGVVSWIIHTEYHHSRQHAQERARIVADGVAARLSAKLGDYELALKQVAEMASVRALDATRCDPAIESFVRLHPDFTALAVRDRAGDLICAYVAHSLESLDGTRIAWFRDGLDRGTFSASGVFFGARLGKWVSAITYPVRGADGNIAGLLVLPIDLKGLAERMFPWVPDDILVGIIGRDGNVLMRSRGHDERVGKPTPAPFLAAMDGRREGQFAAPGVDGVDRLLAFTTLEGAGWRVVAGMDESAVLADFRQKLLGGILLGIPFFALLAVATLWLGSAITKPIRELASTTARVVAGDQGARASVDGPREIKDVAARFNRMLDALEKQREERIALVSHFETLVRNARDIVFLIDPSGTIVEANDAAATAYGYSPQELRGKNILELRTAVNEQELGEQLKAADTPGGVLFETDHRRKDGSTFPVEVSARSLEIGGKRYRQSFVRDITARRDAEAARLAAEERFRTAIESAPMGIFIQVAGRFAYANPQALSLFGAANARELVGQPVLDRFHPGCRDAVRERIRALNETREAVSEAEEVLLRLDGATLDVEVSAVPYVHEGEHGALVFARDIRERKRAYDELRKSEHRFRTLIEGVPHIAVQGYDRDRRVVFWNAASEALYGFTRHEALGRRLEDLIIPPEMRDGVIAAVSRWLEEGIPIPASDLELHRKDGSPVSVYSGHAMLANHLGEHEMYCVDVDLTALRRAEAQAVEWKNRYEAAIRASGQLLHERKPSTNEMAIMGDTMRILGYRPDEMTGGLAQWRELIHPGDLAEFDRSAGRAITSREPFHQVYRVRRSDGEWVTVQDDGYLVLDRDGNVSCMVCFIVDVTERILARRRIEDQIEELRRWHAAMIGRETRTLELKSEVNELLAAAGEAPRYSVSASGPPEGQA